MSGASGSHTVELGLFGCDERVAIPLPAQCSCENALKLIAKKLEIRADSVSVFGLFCGKLGEPYKVLTPSDMVPMGTELCLQRWYTRGDEGKVLKHDAVAIHYLYCEAKEKLRKGHMLPSEEQLAELDSFSDPLFPTERQWLDVARTVPGYTAVVAQHCTAMDAIDDNRATIAAGKMVTVSMDIGGLSLTTEGVVQTLHWPWTAVRRWKRLASTQIVVIKFEVCLQKGNAGVLSWISLDSPQAHLLFQAAGALCSEVKRLQDVKVGLAEPNPATAGKFYDPLKEWVDNVLFAAPNFSKLK